MLNKIVQIFKIRDLRNKILFILGAFAVFRLMANIPIPGIDRQALSTLLQRNQMLGLLNVFTGGSLDNLSVVMLGLGPYITATVILQLLTMVFPQLEQLYKEEGEAGRQKFNQYGRILTVPLAMLQGFGMLTLFQRKGVIPHLPSLLLFTSILTITAGSMFLMWLGELISEKGIGNGVSLLIFAGIISSVPINILRAYTDITNPIKTPDTPGIPEYSIFSIVALLIISGVVLINEAKRNIPISYAKRVRGTKLYGGVSTYLPMSVNPAGVMPIIFALSILTFPGMIANFLTGFSGIIGRVAQSINIFLQNPLIYGILYFFLVVVFVYFYTAVTFDPQTVAENLQKTGGFVPGIRPGNSTAHYLSYILNRILLIGALFLGAIALMPSIIGGITKVRVFRFLIGGTSVLIVVSVILDTIRQINAQLQMREYETI